MKRTYLTLLTMLLSAYLLAEGKFPTIFVPDASQVHFMTTYGRQWTVRYQFPNGESRSGVWYSDVKESTINGKAYVAMTVYERTTKANGSNLQIGGDRTRLDRLFYRQEDDKVYCLTEPGKQELQILDFGLKAGDAFDAADGERFTVVGTGASTDYLERMYGIGEEKPRMLRLRSEQTGEEDVWIEGVGSTQWGIAPPCVMQGVSTFDGTPDKAQVFQAVLHKDIGILDYLADVSEEDYKLAVYYPGAERDKEDAGLTYSFSADTLCISGVFCPTSTFGPECVECKVTDGNVLALVYYGFHVLTTNRKYREINIKIPGFKPGTYYVYNTGDVPEELTCPDGTDGIGKMREEENPDIFYDLAGRRTAHPAKGVYIRQGRKVVK